MPTKRKETAPTTAGGALSAAVSSDEQRRAAAALMGSATSERKKQTSAANGRKAPPGPGRTPKPLEAFPCTCGGSGLDHKSTCPRGQAIRRRQKASRL